MGLIRHNEQYKVRLTDFEGPLDLLLHLVRESKLDIKTIPLASVTAQYIEYLNQLDALDLDLAAEFIEVGATLVEIKSRGILPHEKEAEEDEKEDIEAELRRRLEEYKLLKEASEKLREKENVDRFFKPAQELRPEYKYKLDGLTMDALTEAFTRILHKIHPTAAEIVGRQIRLDRFTVRDKMSDIRAKTHGKRSLMFFDLFEADFTKSEMINTFLALLELLKTGEVRAMQGGAFADIKIVGMGVKPDAVMAEEETYE